MSSEITGKIIAAAIEVHRSLGPGLLESTYEACLCHELTLRGIPCARQFPVPIQYKGLELQCAYRIDLLVESVVVELKVAQAIERVHEAQLLTYMKLGGWKLGLLINFNVRVLRNGVRRMVL